MTIKRRRLAPFRVDLVELVEELLLVAGRGAAGEAGAGDVVEVDLYGTVAKGWPLMRCRNGPPADRSPVWQVRR